MGMAINTGKEGPVADPNIVPLIDVLLVLIIIFMVITPQLSAGLATLVPHPAPPSKSDPEPQAIVVQVMPSGKLLINQEPSSWNELGARLSDIFKQRADKVAFVKGADEIPFADIARAIDIMRQAGIIHIGLITARDNVAP
jgi:biopolymer transport protein TolR